MTQAAADKNKPNKNAEAAPKVAGIDTSGFVQDDIALPPYWNPSEGESIYAQPVMLDATDPTFIRFVLEAKAPVECKRGPSEDAENVHVEVGQRFTCSVYRGLERPFFMYMLAEIPALITCTSKRKLKATAKNPKPRTLWMFTSLMKPEHKAVLDKNRAKWEKLVQAEIEQKEKILAEATEQAEDASSDSPAS